LDGLFLLPDAKKTSSDPLHSHRSGSFHPLLAWLTDLHISNRIAPVRGQLLSPLDRLSIKDARHFRHSFARENEMDGHVYP